MSRPNIFMRGLCADQFPWVGEAKGLIFTVGHRQFPRPLEVFEGLHGASNPEVTGLPGLPIRFGGTQLVKFQRDFQDFQDF